MHVHTSRAGGLHADTHAAERARRTDHLRGGRTSSWTDGMCENNTFYTQLTHATYFKTHLENRKIDLFFEVKKTETTK